MREDVAPGGSSFSRREFLKLGGAGLGGVALLGASACGGGEQQGGPVNLTFTHGPDPSGTFQEQIAAFNEQHGGEIQVEWRQMPAGPGYLDQLTTEYQAGASEIDVPSGDVIWPAEFAASGWILDLSDRFTEGEREGFLPAPIQANTYDGGVWGVPWFTDAGMFYYRTDLLEKSGFSEPPRTWDELKEMTRKVRQDSGIRYGFVFQGANYEGGVVNGLEYIWTHGGDVLSGDEVVIDSPEAVAGLATERSMVAEGITPQAVATYTEQESQQTFLNGDAVFMRNWPYVYGSLTDPALSRIKPEQVDVAPLPAAEGNESFSGLGGWNLFISATSEDQAEAAWEFIRYMSAPEQQKRRALGGGYLPTLEDLYDDREILDEVPVIALGKEAILNTRPRPVSPYYSDMALEMAEQFNASLKGDVPPEEAAGTLQEQLQNIIEQAS